MLSTFVLAVLAVRWIGWTDGPNPVPQAWVLAAPALGLLSTSTLALLRSLVRQRRDTRRVAEWVRLRAIPIQPAIAVVIADAGIARCRLVRDEQPYAFTFGIFRPIVVVTSALFNELDAGPLRAILLHEAAHARARDPGRLFLARAIAAGLLGFPPAARAQGRCHQWAELAADRAVLGQLGPRPLAVALLALLRRPGRLLPRAEGSVVEADDLLPARLLQLSAYPERLLLPPSGRGEKLAISALVGSVVAAAAVPCTLFTALLAQM
ncbi:MAG: M56 family metallopeptidase [Gaiellaceae bacterium]